MTKYFLKLTVLLGGCVLCSCAENQPLSEEKIDEPQLDKMVARVTSVNEAAEYVLIQRYARLVIPENAVLYTVGLNNDVASIKVTGERLGQFLAADIISGKLVVGDAVYLRNFEKEESLDSQ